jgi:hypothetical protein
MPAGLLTQRRRTARGGELWLLLYSRRRELHESLHDRGTVGELTLQAAEPIGQHLKQFTSRTFTHVLLLFSGGRFCGRPESRTSV